MKRSLWLIVALLAWSLASADDLGGLVRKSEGRGGNKPTPSQNSNDNRSNNAPSNNNGGGSDDLFRKKSRTQPSQTSPSNAPQERGRSDGMVLQNPKAVEINSKPLLTYPQPQNRPVPIDDRGYLPGLVRRTEGLDSRRWSNDRFIIINPYPDYYGAETWIEYRIGNIRFSYRYYVIQPVPYRVCYTPYWYYDPCPPFIPVYRVVYLPPTRVVYVEVPVYVETPYYLDRTPRNHDERQAILSDLRALWKLRDIQFIERYIRPNSHIAVYLEGKYAYSLPAEDYLEMTRDALRVIKTEEISFYRVTKRGENQLVVRGEHRYIDDATGMLKVVYVSYTFEYADGRWYLSEVGSSATRL
ncbi:hypothetical protein GBSOP10_101423 [Armatimonadetes bacterium GBS]|jgi:hypothetical protein|nr:MAG: hypothetical protein KatS3mg021_2003 [Fimbriimonadales bacterium]CUU01971.1 hypothetical protein GBSOP10_101423 [Armatimonadetes bacterium GBS]CUU35707.1 hypothetical protein GXSOP10_121171 [Armatimonadetes bacterium GXS]